MTRTEALCKAFGWQGGTIHQIAEHTGCSVWNLIYGEPLTLDGAYQAGFDAVKMSKCIDFKRYHGNLSFWIGVAAAYQEK